MITQADLHDLKYWHELNLTKEEYKKYVSAYFIKKVEMGKFTSIDAQNAERLIEHAYISRI